MASSRSTQASNLSSLESHPYGNWKGQRRLNSVEAKGADAPLLTECPFDVEIRKDADGRAHIFGRGAWSTVYRGIARAKQVSFGGLPTPPTSPTGHLPLIVAVKTPARRDAQFILRSEGLILSYLARQYHYEDYVTRFYGVIPSTESLVLGAVPLSLHGYLNTRDRRPTVHEPRWTTTQDQDPAVGSTAAWLDLAHQSVAALTWLHNEAGVVHGDVKPGNLLLSARRCGPDPHSLPFNVLFADFSSSQMLGSDSITPNTLSAVTREYTAPELLSSAILKDPKSTATTESDVFSLAVTLLVAATGDLAVYSGSMWQRQAMAMQGWNVIRFVQSGDQGLKVPKAGMVEQVLERAVLKAGTERINAGTWVDLVETKMKGKEPVKL